MLLQISKQFLMGTIFFMGIWSVVISNQQAEQKVVKEQIQKVERTLAQK